MANGNVSLDELHDTLQMLHDELDVAYWDASTVVAKDKIKGIEDAIFDVLKTLNSADISQRTPAYQKAIDTVRLANGKLSELRNQMDRLVHNINTASEVAASIDKALTVIAKFLAA